VFLSFEHTFKNKKFTEFYAILPEVLFKKIEFWD